MTYFDAENGLQFQKVNNERKRKNQPFEKQEKLKKDNNQPKKSGWLRVKRNEGNNKLQK